MIKEQLFKNLSQKKAWKHVKQMFKNNAKEMPTLHKNGSQATTDLEKADMLMENCAEISNNLPKTEGFHQHYNHILISNQCNHFAHLNNQTTNNNSRYNNTKSKFIKINNGLPQGGVPAPLIFIINIDDLAKLLKCIINLYADDFSLTARAIIEKLRIK